MNNLASYQAEIDYRREQMKRSRQSVTLRRRSKRAAVAGNKHAR
jgi:hypothetical protein